MDFRTSRAASGTANGAGTARFFTALAALCLFTTAGCVRRVVSPEVLADAKERGTPPPGTVELNIVSQYADQSWNVYADGDVVCSTPCARLFDAHGALTLRSRDGDWLDASALGEEALEARRAVLVAEGTNSAKQVNGIVFTTLGGMGLVTAITFTAVGCSDVERRGGLCTAGLITGAASVPITAFALWMLLDSGPKAHVLPVFTTQASDGGPPTRIAVVPNGVVGTF